MLSVGGRIWAAEYYNIIFIVITVIGLCLATKNVDLWQNLCTTLFYFVVCVVVKKVHVWLVSYIYTRQ